MPDELSGEALNVAVAEQVMGWRHAGDNDPLRWFADDGGYIADGIPYIIRIGVIGSRWQPSTDIAAAWEVAEKVCEIKRGALNARLEFEFHFSITIEDGDFHFASFHVTECAPDGAEYYSKSYQAHTRDNPALAICRAALAAVAGRG